MQRNLLSGPIVLAIGLFLCLTGCATGGRGSGGPDGNSLKGYTIIRGLSLPEGDKRYDCGPEALTTVLNHLGDPVKVQTVIDDIYSPEHEGTMSVDLLGYTKQRGFVPRLYRGPDLETLKALVRSGTPAIVMVDLGQLPLKMERLIRPQGLFHFFVVVGFNDDLQKVVCEYYGTDIWVLPYDALIEAWDEAGRFLMTVHRPDDPILTIRSGAAQVIVRNVPKALTARKCLEQGRAHEKRGELEAAFLYYSEAWSRSGGLELDAGNGMAGVLRKQGQLVAAADALRKVLQVDAKDIRAQNDLAYVLLQIGGAHRAEALKVAERMNDLFAEDDRSVTRAYALSTLGQALEANGRMKDARAAYLKSIECADGANELFHARRQLDLSRLALAATPRSALSHANTARRLVDTYRERMGTEFDAQMKAHEAKGEQALLDRVRREAAEATQSLRPVAHDAILAVVRAAGAIPGKEVEALKTLSEVEADASDTEREFLGECAYLRGQLSEQIGQADAAQSAYEKAMLLLKGERRESAREALKRLEDE